MEQTTQAETKLRRVGRPKKSTIKEYLTVDYPGADTKAQDMALRIWEGQSIDVPIQERVERIQRALVAQGLSPLVELPHPDAGRYL
jgi:hypothetical protein